MYGLPQSGLLANEILEKRLNKRGYQQSTLVTGLWKHDWRLIQFTLVVDDFGVKIVEEKHALHLKQTLKENYKVTTEWDGTRYTGITLDWDCRRRQVNLYQDKPANHSNNSTTQKRKTKPTIPKCTYHISCQKTIRNTTILSAAD